MKELTTVDKEGWKAELPLIKEHFATFGAKLPKGLKDELAALEKRLAKAEPLTDGAEDVRPVRRARAKGSRSSSIRASRAEFRKC